MSIYFLPFLSSIALLRRIYFLERDRIALEFDHNLSADGNACRDLKNCLIIGQFHLRLSLRRPWLFIRGAGTSGLYSVFFRQFRWIGAAAKIVTLGTDCFVIINKRLPDLRFMTTGNSLHPVDIKARRMKRGFLGPGYPARGIGKTPENVRPIAGVPQQRVGGGQRAGPGIIVKPPPG